MHEFRKSYYPSTLTTYTLNLLRIVPLYHNHLTISSILLSLVVSSRNIGPESLHRLYSNTFIASYFTARV